MKIWKRKSKFLYCFLSYGSIYRYMRRFVIYISLLLILTSFTLSQKKPKSIAKEKTQKTIALIRHKYLYFIQIKLNNKNANLLIDTGSTNSLLDINQSKKYKFDYAVTLDNFTGIGGSATRYRVKNYNFNHDSTTLKIRPLGADLLHINEILADDKILITGILGSDFFTVNNVIIDFKNNQLIIHN